MPMPKVKISTSYYSSREINRERHFLVQVSNSVPGTFVPDAVFREVFPDWNTIVTPYKNGSLDLPTYTRLYRQQLETRSPSILLHLEQICKQAAGKDIILLCYEKPGHFCHRRILADWLEKHPSLDNCLLERKIQELGTDQLSLF